MKRGHARRRVISAASLLLMLAAAGAVVLAGSDRTAATIPSPYSHFQSTVVITDAGANVQLWVDAIPDHKSPYFFPNDPRYEAYNGSNPNWQQNPNHIGVQSIQFTIPANPQVAAVHQATPLGPIGLAVNGVPFFNQYAGPAQPLTNEINSFDQYNGHPQQESMYHYHVVPAWLTAQLGQDALLGYLLDGFPVYGPLEDGQTLVSADLDQYHGHSHATADYPAGIYHYHVTADAPYLNGAGFYGTPGTVQLNAPTPVITATPTPTPSPTPTPTPTPAPADSDGDGVDDAADNCPMWPNPGQGMPLWTVPPGDGDCDGYPTTRETFMITDAARHCAATATANDESTPDGWPVDFNDDQKATILDVATFSAVFGSLAPGPPYNVRHDFNGSGTITILDVAQYSAFFGKSCSP